MTPIGYIVVFVGEMKRSLAFYRDGLGLVPTFTSDAWCQFATEGGVLALHISPLEVVAGGMPGKAPGTCRPGLAAADLDAFHAAAIGRGVPCVEPPHDLEAGDRIALYADPDGLVVSVVELR